MSKDNLKRIADVISFSAVCIATVLVMIFQFVGEATLVKIAMGFYAFGFLTLASLFAVKVYESFKKPKEEKTETETESVNDENVEKSSENQPQTPVLSENQTRVRIWNIVGFAGAFLVFVFTLIVLILF